MWRPRERTLSAPFAGPRRLRQRSVFGRPAAARAASRQLSGDRRLHGWQLPDHPNTQGQQGGEDRGRRERLRLRRHRRELHHEAGGDEPEERQHLPVQLQNGLVGTAAEQQHNGEHARLHQAGRHAVHRAFGPQQGDIHSAYRQKKRGRRQEAESGVGAVHAPRAGAEAHSEKGDQRHAVRSERLAGQLG